MKKNIIVVTGGAGFVGSALVKRLSGNSLVQIVVVENSSSFCDEDVAVTICFFQIEIILID